MEFQLEDGSFRDVLLLERGAGLRRSGRGQCIPAVFTVSGSIWMPFPALVFTLKTCKQLQLLFFHAGFFICIILIYTESPKSVLILADLKTLLTSLFAALVESWFDLKRRLNGGILRICAATFDSAATASKQTRASLIEAEPEVERLPGNNAAPCCG